MEFQPSSADKLRREATSFYAIALFLGLLAIAWAVAWYIAISTPLDWQPEGIQPGEGVVTHIEWVHPSKDYSYIHLDIRAHGRMESWYYREYLQTHAPGLKTLRIGDFVKASIAPGSKTEIWELRRGDEILLSLDQVRASRKDVGNLPLLALGCGTVSIILALIGRARRRRAENLLPDSQTLAERFAHIAWPIYGGSLLLLVVTSTYFLDQAGINESLWVTGPGVILLGLVARRIAWKNYYLDENCCLGCGSPLGSGPALRFPYGRGGVACGYCLSCAPVAQRVRYITGGLGAFSIGALLLMFAYPYGITAGVLTLIFDLTVLPLAVRWLFRGKMR